MKRGFVFTIAFSLFFLMLLYSAAFYKNMGEMRRGALESADISKENYVADDVGYDYLAIWGMKTGLARDVRLRWTVEDRIPANGDMESTLKVYEEFVAGEYSRTNNINAKAELDRTGELRLEPQGIVYRHSGNDLIVDGVVSEYQVKGRLTKTCGGGCSGSGNWEWGSAGEGPFVSLELVDANGSRVDILGKTSGYVRLNGTSTAYVPLGNGGLEIRLSSRQLRIVFTNSGAEVKTTVSIASNEPAVVYAPVRLTVGDRVFEKIVLIEK